MIDTLFWSTGAIIWTGITLLLTFLLAECLWALACAASLVRFAARVARHLDKSQTIGSWEIMFGTFRRWSEMFGHRNNGSNHRFWHLPQLHAEWRGIGDHTFQPQ